MKIRNPMVCRLFSHAQHLCTIISSDTLPNFISNIFYLSIAMSHHGYLQTIQNYNNLAKHIDDLQRHLDMLNGDGSWMGVPVIL
jgi:ubiquitin conjugation factor E4 B